MSDESRRAPILLVDDDAVFLASLKIIFRSYPSEWEVYTAGSVAEALVQLASHPIEIAILDIRLPDGTAADIVRAAGSVPCMLCTQDSPEPAFKEIFDDHSVAQNVVGFLTKPLQRDVIWDIRTAWRIGMERKERNRLVAEATAQFEEERRVIAQNLHDEIGASLTQLTWAFGNFDRAIKEDPSLSPATREQFGAISAKGQKILHDTFHEVSRIVTWLRPETVNVAGLRYAIEFMVSQWKEAAPGVEFECEAGEDLKNVDSRRAGVIYRLVQEGITNAMRHADPVSIRVSLVCRGTELVLEVLSTGSVRHEEGHYKLSSLRERTASLGGVLKFAVDSNLGQSSLAVSIPL